MRNPYHTLGLRESASLDEVKKAYRKYAMHFHPDKHEGSKFFNVRLKEIKEAFDLINNGWSVPVIRNDEKTIQKLTDQIDSQKELIRKQLGLIEKLQVEITKAEAELMKVKRNDWMDRATDMFKE